MNAIKKKRPSNKSIFGQNIEITIIKKPYPYQLIWPNNAKLEFANKAGRELDLSEPVE